MTQPARLGSSVLRFSGASCSYIIFSPPYKNCLNRYQMNCFKFKQLRNSLQLNTVCSYSLIKDYFVAKSSSAAPTPPDAYERLAIRVQKIINSTNAQKAKAALIFRLPDEPEDEWERLLEEIAENDNVTLAYRDDGGVQIFWVVPKED